MHIIQTFINSVCVCVCVCVCDVTVCDVCVCVCVCGGVHVYGGVHVCGVVHVRVCMHVYVSCLSEQGEQEGRRQETIRLTSRETWQKNSFFSND